jgi:diguanylate cyclase (GGDEF)-like protein
MATTRPRSRTRLPHALRLAPLGGIPSWLAADVYLFYTFLLAPVALAVALVSGSGSDLVRAAVVSALFVPLQASMGHLPGRFQRTWPIAWSLLRFGVVLAYVGTLVELVGGPAKPLASLFVPVVAAAAAVGVPQGAAVAAVASAIYLAPEVDRLGGTSQIAVRGIALAGVSILLAFGTRSIVSALQSAARQVRTSAVLDRRRTRQIAAIESIGRVLATSGPTPEMLDQVVGVLVGRFSYGLVSIYLAEGGLLRLGAQRGYTQPIPTFDGSTGVVGRVMRSHELAFVPDVRTDPDYVALDDAVVSEICAPLQVDGRFMGILNVEATSRRLDRTDRDLVAILSQRVGAAVALGQDRRALTERISVFNDLHRFTEAVNSSLDPKLLYPAVAEAVAGMLSAELVAITVLDRATSRYLVEAGVGVTPATVGREIHPGEGMAGRAIRERAVVIDEHFGREHYPASVRQEAIPDVPIGVGVPLLRGGVVIGAITIGRRTPLRAIEIEALELLAGHAALAISNAFLHADVEELAIRDALTGLYNRRYFDETLERMLAARRRDRLNGARPLSAVIFDLDHFGRFNKQHGHQVGDAVLRLFAEILRGRFRAADLVARLGGEEFIVILDGAQLADAQRIAEQVRGALARHAVPGSEGEILHVTVSAGCTQLDDAEPTRESLLRSADVALFMAKRAGRDRVVAA